MGGCGAVWGTCVNHSDCDCHDVQAPKPDELEHQERRKAHVEESAGPLMSGDQQSHARTTVLRLHACVTVIYDAQSYRLRVELAHDQCGEVCIAASQRDVRLLVLGRPFVEPFGSRAFSPQVQCPFSVIDLEHRNSLVWQPSWGSI